MSITIWIDNVGGPNAAVWIREQLCRLGINANVVMSKSQSLTIVFKDEDDLNLFKLSGHLRQSQRPEWHRIDAKYMNGIKIEHWRDKKVFDWIQRPEYA